MESTTVKLYSLNYGNVRTYLVRGEKRSVSICGRSENE